MTLDTPIRPRGVGHKEWRDTIFRMYRERDTRLDEVLTQRDELLAALKQINALPSELAGDAWAIARAAIAKAEGK